LTVWEEADGLAYLSERFGYTHEEIAKKIGKSRTTVTESMALAGLPEPIRAKCLQAGISAKSTLLEVARQFDESAMHEFLDNIGNSGKQNLKREEVRRAARPALKAKETSNAANQNSLKSCETHKSFRYDSEGKDFYLEIRFNKSGDYEKKDILRALKEVFDKTKREL
jgi:ParB family chromosome partitioning protein